MAAAAYHRPRAGESLGPSGASIRRIHDLEARLERAEAAAATAERLRLSSETALASEARRAREATESAERASAALAELRASIRDQTSEIRQARGRAEAAEQAMAAAGPAVLRLVEDIRRAVLRGDADCAYRLSCERRGRRIAASLGATSLADETHTPYEPETEAAHA